MDYRAKVSLIGDERTGKTSIILRYIKNSFTEEYITTLGADFIDKSFNHSEISDLKVDDIFTITIWDMAGQKHFKEIASIYTEGSAGIVIVFDVSNSESFNSVEEWFEFAQVTCPKAEVVIIGNKSDLECVIPADRLNNMETKLGKKILYTSAKVGLEDDISNVKNVFTELATTLLKRYLTR